MAQKTLKMGDRLVNMKINLLKLRDLIKRKQAKMRENEQFQRSVIINSSNLYVTSIYPYTSI